MHCRRGKSGALRDSLGGLLLGSRWRRFWVGCQFLAVTVTHQAMPCLTCAQPLSTSLISPQRPRYHSRVLPPLPLRTLLLSVHQCLPLVVPLLTRPSYCIFLLFPAGSNAPKVWSTSINELDRLTSSYLSCSKDCGQDATFLRLFPIASVASG